MKHKNHIAAVLFETIKRNILLSVTLLLAIAGTIVTGVLPPLVLERIINELLLNKTIRLQMVVIYFLFLVAAGLFDAGKECLITVFGQRVTHGLRSELCGKLSRLPAAYYMDNEPGVTVSRFVNDVDTVESLFTSGIISMAVDICKVVMILAVVFVKSKGLGLMLLVVLPFLFIMTRKFQQRMLKSQIMNRAAVGKINNHIPETIKNIRMIHTFRKEKFMENRYDNYIKESYSYIEKSNFYDAIYSPIIIFVSAVLIAIMMMLSASGGEMQMFFGMSVGTAVAVTAYVGKVFEPLENIGMEIQNIQSAVAGICRINEFLDENELKIPNEQAVFMTDCSSVVELKNVTFRYNEDQEILHRYSLCVNRGENVTLTGRTGAGKSTIFKLLLGLYQPQNGKVTVFGMDADKIPEAQKRKIFGYVEQTFRLIPGTVKEQITLKDSTISDKDVKNAVRIAGMEEAVLSLEKGYDTLCTDSLFSQGQMQLLSIARAVAANPAILLLDEITANLDSVTEAAVLNALKEASRNRTVISISHRLYEHSGGRIICLDQDEKI